MADYSVRTEDDKGRQIHPVLCNTAKDGSGTWYFALVDSDGHLQVDVLSIAAGTNVIGKARLVTATGDEITDDTADAIKALLKDSAGANIESVTPGSDITNTHKMLNVAAALYGYDTTTAKAVAAQGIGDALAAAQRAVWAVAAKMGSNGTTLDIERHNLDVTLLASSARTATTNSADQTNHNGRGVLVTLDVTSVTDTPSVVLAIEAKDPASGKYEPLLTATAVTATGTHSYIVYPGGDVTASECIVKSVGFPLPRTWRVSMTHADADSITYSVGAMVIR